MNSKKLPHIGISTGDFNGIGPEIILKSFLMADHSLSVPVVFGPASVFRYYNDRLDLDVPLNVTATPEEAEAAKLNIVDYRGDEPEITPGIQSAVSGQTAMISIDDALKAAVNGQTDAIITAPISKEAVNLAGYKIPGHTEYLAEQTNTHTVVMMLVNENLRVALATTHIPVSEVADSLNAEGIRTRLQILHRSLVNDFGIEKPEIAVFGLNPHAGDGGVIGRDEEEFLLPLLKELKTEGLPLSGLFPADGFFGQKQHKEYDAIFAMYHDQGLIPFKLLSFGKGVNFTAGLPVIRTSPDHGTAFNIAGKGIANPSSFIQAWNLAIKLAEHT